MLSTGSAFDCLNALISFVRRDMGIGGVRAESVVSEKPIDSGRIDVFAEGTWQQGGTDILWCMAIEAKIGSGERDEQLSTYDEWVNDKFGDREIILVFLTPDGRDSRTGSAERKWLPLSFAKLAGVFRNELSGFRDKPGYHFLRYYLTGVLHDVCELKVPMRQDCDDPYSANDYLKQVLGNF